MDSETITIRLPSDLKRKLEALAVRTNRSRSWLAAQAIATYVDEPSWQIQQIEDAVALADSPQATWVDGSDLESWLESWSNADWASPLHRDLPSPPR